jgi:hypothetical protein
LTRQLSAQVEIAALGIVIMPPGAEGGIVTGPTLAMIGERGPEAVVPLGRWVVIPA